jgi:hypothetical protein
MANPFTSPAGSAISGPPASTTPWYSTASTPANAAYLPPAMPQPGAPAAAAQPAQQQPATTTPELTTMRFWTTRFYQQFFDVDTNDVLMRMGNVLLPFVPPDFLRNRRWHMEGFSAPGALGTVASAFTTSQERRADLYGPFWLCTTLWIVLAVVSNMMSKLAYNKQVDARNQLIAQLPSGVTLEPLSAWKYDFTNASVGALVIYLFVLLLSLLIWGLMKWKSVPVGLTDTLCLYGYSMFVYILCAILCSVPIKSFQWTVCILAFVWSAAYLLLNFWQLWKTTLNTFWFVGVVVLVLGCQIGLTLAFKLYFFNYAY